MTTDAQTDGYLVDQETGPHTVGKKPSWGIYRVMLGGAGRSLVSRWPSEQSARDELDRLEGKSALTGPVKAP